MSKFHSWFKKAYKRWRRSQPGEEDFLAFCDLLGYPPLNVLSWLNGELIPEGPEQLAIAFNLGMDVYKTVDLPQPDPKILEIFGKFSHLKGEERSKLAFAVYEIQEYTNSRGISTNSPEFKEVIRTTFEKYGLDK